MSDSVTQEATRVVMTQIVLPEHTNNHGTIFGGQLVAWMDIAGSVCAMRFARGPVVTLSIDELHFVLPVRKGMIVELKGQVNQAWNSSMEIGVRVEAEVPDTGRRVHCCSGFLTFVALDSEGVPTRIGKTLEIESGQEDRAEAAQKRRAHRLASRKPGRGN
jgi:acyl-CoA hydrolase